MVFIASTQPLIRLFDTRQFDVNACAKSLSVAEESQTFPE